jgi:hypothetical protein
MEDGRRWKLQRSCQEFHDLQTELIAMHPVEAGSAGQNERTLAFISGPVTYVTDSISNDRCAKIDEYIQDLLKLGPNIVHGQLVKDFFAARLGDCEVEP